MNRTAEQIALDIDAEEALIGKLYIEQADPPIRTFERLKAILQQLAEHNKDIALGQ